MSVIAIASVKGGVGKSTTVIVLATELHRRGYKVAIVDSDPRHHSAKFFARAAIADLMVRDDVTEDTMLDAIVDLSAGHDVVLVDLQGSANQAMLMAFGRSDLVLVPVQPSFFDSDDAVTTIKTVRAAAKMTGRAIAERILLSRTNPSCRTKAAVHVRGELERLGLCVMRTEFEDRTPLKEMTISGEAPTLTTETKLSSSMKGAIANIQAICDEVLATLGGLAAAAAE